MTIERHKPGSRMSQAVVHKGMVFLAGQVGTPGASTAEQTRSALAKVDELLAMSGSDKSQMLSANLWLTDMADFAEMNAVWDAWIDRANPPARACVEAKLASPELRFEVMIVAVQA